VRRSSLRYGLSVRLVVSSSYSQAHDLGGRVNSKTSTHDESHGAASTAPGNAGTVTPTALAAIDDSSRPAEEIKAKDVKFSDLMTQDVRFAVAMSGGVSLAVWMGGVAREVNLLQQASNFRVNETRVNAKGSGAAGQPSGADGPVPRAGRPGVPASDWDGQCRDLYLNLLGLLDLKVTVDVLSGTSAGGINAALLGLSSAAGVDLARLRDLWLTTGSMDTLLRDPGEKNPPSLMQGDKVLFNGLYQGISDLYNHRCQDLSMAPPDVVDTTVFITTTMMSGETSRFTDDYGTLVPDVDHHGLFTFDRGALAPNAGAPALTALALAARSSASFPGAFEPSFVPINCSIAAGQGIPGRPDMADFANMTRSHWVADGGLLANRPLTPLLAQVFSQPATGQVRRVLAFVVPDGGGTASPAAQPDAEQWKQPPTMASALKEDLDAQFAQSIASDLQAVRVHNQRITTSHNLRRYLAEMGARPPIDGSLVTSGLLRDYQRQQGAGLAQPLLDEVMRQLTTMKLPDRWATELSADRPADIEPPESRMAKKMVSILGAGWHAGPQDGPAPAPPPDPAQPAQVSAASGAAPGRAATEAGSGGSVEGEEAPAWGAWDTAADDSFSRAAAFGLPVFHAARATAIQLVRLGYQRATNPDQRNKITGHRTTIEETYQASPPDWHERNEVDKKLTEAAKGGPDPEDLVQVAADLAEAKRLALLIGPLPRPPAMAKDVEAYKAAAAEVRDSWEKLAAALRGLLADLRQPGTLDGRDSRKEAAEAIGVYLRYFGGARADEELADRLLNLVIAERALEPAEPEVDLPVEFIQVSANTRTLLALKNELDSVNKLRGVELHHFAAFYNSSWRAYDWMWGRMDGSGWLVHILLDPRRILAIIEDQYANDDPDHQWEHGQRAKNFAALLREAVGLPVGLEGDCLEKDLRFLDDPNAVIPVSLPNSALFLAQAWQNLIAANELPTIAEQMLADSGGFMPLIDPRNTAGAQSKPPVSTRVRTTWYKVASAHRQNQPLHGLPDPWATNVLTMKHQNKEAADFAKELPSCPVRLQTLAGQMHTPAFARLAAKAAAVATATFATAPEMPGAVRPVLASARTVTRTGYLATKVTGGSGWKTLLIGVVLAVVGGVMATQGLIAVGVTGTVVALVGLYLIALGAWGIHRGLLGALTAITALALAGSLTLTWVRNQIWGITPKGSTGLVPKHVLPWLQSNWWGGLALIGGVILLAALLSVVTRRRPRRNRRLPRWLRAVTFRRDTTRRR
jgi:predicted acylesterase/phospholipase RssA